MQRTGQARDLRTARSLVAASRATPAVLVGATVILVAHFVARVDPEGVQRALHVRLDILHVAAFGGPVLTFVAAAFAAARERVTARAFLLGVAALVPLYAPPGLVAAGGALDSEHFWDALRDSAPTVWLAPFVLVCASMAVLGRAPPGRRLLVALAPWVLGAGLCTQYALWVYDPVTGRHEAASPHWASASTELLAFRCGGAIASVLLLVALAADRRARDVRLLAAGGAVWVAARAAIDTLGIVAAAPIVAALREDRHASAGDAIDPEGIDALASVASVIELVGLVAALLAVSAFLTRRAVRDDRRRTGLAIVALVTFVVGGRPGEAHLDVRRRQLVAAPIWTAVPDLDLPVWPGGAWDGVDEHANVVALSRDGSVYGFLHPAAPPDTANLVLLDRGATLGDLRRVSAYAHDRLGVVVLASTLSGASEDAQARWGFVERSARAVRVLDVELLDARPAECVVGDDAFDVCDATDGERTFPPKWSVIAPRTADDTPLFSLLASSDTIALVVEPRIAVGSPLAPGVMAPSWPRDLLAVQASPAVVSAVLIVAALLGLSWLQRALRRAGRPVRQAVIASVDDAVAPSWLVPTDATHELARLEGATYRTKAGGRALGTTARLLVPRLARRAIRSGGQEVWLLARTLALALVAAPLGAAVALVLANLF